MIAAILIGRKGSTGFPGKNMHPVLGRPLSQYPLLAAEHSRLVTHTFISTDDPDIMELGRSNGAEIIERPARLATKEALGEDAYVHAYETIVERHGRPEALVLLMCNAATILAETIDEGISVLRERPEVDSAVTASCYNMWSPLRARKINENGLLDPFVPFETFGDPATLNCDRDSQGDVYFADMGVSVIRPECIENMEDGLLPQKWMGRNIHPLPQWGGCDLDYEWQLPGVEFWLYRHGFREDRTPYED
ncbi:acylneuraminate cytidylyltransferase family protein [Salidesulfovibrio brasiliensis]|uniref:acylneuraminate cytidylyltransferase family protein n=1 Tax=Salidesulfovibrio brasiliensis TaxID=221711 RepID=UPI0006D2AD3B|nr:cytidylyltransferase [Salidesulfovibrio brasiliensis]